MAEASARYRPGTFAGARQALAPVLIIAALLGEPGPARAAFDAASYGAEVAQRRDYVIARYGRALRVPLHPKFYPYFALVRTRLSGCDPQIAEYMAGVLGQVDSAGEPELFSGPPLARFVYRHAGCLTPAQRDRIERALERPRDLFGHGTINHASMRSTSIYLMAQAFPAAVWTDRDGRRYGQGELMARLKDLMVRRYGRFLQDGETEQLSPTYAAMNFFSALNLVEFARDPEVKAYAEAYAVQHLAILRISSLQGVILAPIHRQNAQQRSGPAKVSRPCISPSQHLLWMYFGEPEIGPHDLESGCEPTYGAMLADSEWLPPSVIASFPDDEALPVDHMVAVPNFSIWDAEPKPFLSGKVHRSRSFAIGAANSIFDPGGYHMADNTFMLAWRRPSAEFNYVECFHPYWTSNAGVGAWSTIRVPPGFAPNATSRSSPFQQSFFDRGRGVLLFSIPEKDPWPASREPRFFAARDRQKDALFARQNCHFPKSVHEWRQEGSWVFVRAGETYLGIEAVGLTPTLNEVADDPTVLGFVRMTTDARHAALFFVTGEAARHPSFAAFQEEARKIPRRHDPSEDAFSFTGEDGTVNRVVFRLEPEPGTGRMRSLPAVTQNGRPVTMRAEPVIHGPSYRVGQGRLHLRTRHGTLDVIARPGAPPDIRQELAAPLAR